MSERDAPSSARLDAAVPDPALHLDFAARQFADPRVALWHWPERPGRHGGSRTRAQSRTILEHGARAAAERGFSLWWWRERASGELVGQIGLNATDLDGMPVVEVGWSLSPERWGEGFASEAAAASVSFGFDTIGLERIVSFTMVENAASRAVMKRIGLHYVREFDRQGLPHALYETRRSEWPPARA